MFFTLAEVDALLRYLEPRWRREVDGFGNVEPNIESAVICLRFADDKFTRHLNDFMQFYTMFQ